VSAELQTSGYVIAVTGLQAEARVAARSPRTRAVAGGGDAACLERLIDQSITNDCRGLVSFGMAGALRGDLRPGTCLIGREVTHEKRRYPTDEAWTVRLKSQLVEAEIVSFAGVDRPVVTSAQKRALFAETGAAAADMESHLAARTAAKHNLPFAILRVVADPEERGLPPAALAGMRADGTTDAGAVLRSLGRNPGQFLQLARVATDACRAYGALLRCYRRLGPGLGLIDLG
jgi:adenosylhomocysteine nucleosidase